MIEITQFLELYLVIMRRLTSSLLEKDFKFIFNI
jgi:DnaJ homolog subfamily A member 5